MCAHWPYLLLLIPAAPLAWSDFRRREVAVAWLVVLGAAAIAVGWMTEGLRTILTHSAANMIILLLLGGSMAIWQVVRRRPLRAFFVRSFGAGDAVMMAAVAPLFEPVAYVHFLLASSLAALIWWTLKRPATIPLAGFMALTLCVYTLCKTAGLWS